MQPTKFELAIALIDQVNGEDPNTIEELGLTFSKEVVYAKRMTQKLLQFKPDASEKLQIAARAQHIGRWKIARSAYEMDRVGYLRWREELKKMHATLTQEILEKVGYDKSFIDQVASIILKKGIKTNPESQTIEDVICLVFLDYYFEDFAAKHEEDKIISILKKTWSKMSNQGHESALALKLSTNAVQLITKALA